MKASTLDHKDVIDMKATVIERLQQDLERVKKKELFELRDLVGEAIRGKTE